MSEAAAKPAEATSVAPAASAAPAAAAVAPSAGGDASAEGADGEKKQSKKGGKLRRADFRGAEADQNSEEGGQDG